MSDLQSAGESMDVMLDTASDRSIQPPGRISLGPLPPRRYLIELYGTREHRQEQIQLVDRDVDVIIR